MLLEAKIRCLEEFLQQNDLGAFVSGLPDKGFRPGNRFIGIPAACHLHRRDC
jgi:hypothetical protein